VASNFLVELGHHRNLTIHGLPPQSDFEVLLQVVDPPVSLHPYQYETPHNTGQGCQSSDPKLHELGIRLQGPSISLLVPERILQEAQTGYPELRTIHCQLLFESLLRTCIQGARAGQANPVVTIFPAALQLRSLERSDFIL
jgi:hypothetical protein